MPAMNIRPSAAIRQNYNEIADLCRKTAEPVFLTKNGEGDLVVMDIDTYNRREKMLKLREELLAVEEDRLHGSEGYSIDEVTSMMRSAIKEASGHGTAKQIPRDRVSTGRRQHPHPHGRPCILHCLPPNPILTICIFILLSPILARNRKKPLTERSFRSL